MEVLLSDPLLGENTCSSWTTMLSRHFASHVPASKWFLNSLCLLKEKWFEKYLFHSELFVRDNFLKMINTCLARLSELEAPLLETSPIPEPIHMFYVTRMMRVIGGDQDGQQVSSNFEQKKYEWHIKPFAGNLKVIQIVLAIFENIVSNPKKNKYRVLRCNSRPWYLLKEAQALAFVMCAGFKDKYYYGNSYLILPEEINLLDLKAGITVLKAGMVGPKSISQDTNVLHQQKSSISLDAPTSGSFTEEIRNPENTPENTIEEKCVTANFLCLAMSIMEESRVQWRIFSQYYSIFVAASQLGHLHRCYLNRAFLPSRLLDQYMGRYSENIYYYGSRVEVGQDSLYADLNPCLMALAHIMVGAKNRAPVSKLPPTAYFNCPQYSIDPLAFSYYFQEDVLASLITQAYSPKSNALIANHFSFEDWNTTYLLASVAGTIIEKVAPSAAWRRPTVGAVNILQELVLLDDSLTTKRVSLVLNYKGVSFMKILERNFRQSTNRSSYLWNILRKWVLNSPIVAGWLLNTRTDFLRVFEMSGIKDINTEPEYTGLARFFEFFINGRLDIPISDLSFSFHDYLHERRTVKSY
eukprot:TRINITY_DN8857_c0_g2_i4.p1 TRINITY_DN8857_c0_g2~~TRINITY_DN8857_c0_g2_i4.p1  ORF type:complete len:582 (+),score=88.80 TRINITY_DN8857_c0_g2_i4:800-2545(+)